MRSNFTRCLRTRKATPTSPPGTPGKFIVWFRNETTLLVLWQPPYPAGYYTDYKVSIKPEDANQSELYVQRETEPPGPAQVNTGLSLVNCDINAVF